MPYQTVINSRVIEPSWRPLGIQEGKHGPRYWIEIQGTARGYRPVDMHSVDFLARIYPDLEYWRRMFPWGFGRKIDTTKAASYFIKAARDAGPYTPDYTRDKTAGESAE